MPVRHMWIPTAPAVLVTLLGGMDAAAQSQVRVYAESPATAPEGASFDVRVLAELTGFGPNAAVGAFGMDLRTRGDDHAIASISTASFASLSLGTRAGVVAGDDLLRVVGGQMANVFGANPWVDRANPIELFRVRISVDAGTSGSTIEFAPANPNTSGGVVVYPDATSGASIVAPAAAALVFEGATTAITDPLCGPADLALPAGVLDVFDILAFFSAFADQLASADVDANSRFDIFDILGFFEEFTRPC